MNELILTRYLSTPYGTLGNLHTPRGCEFATMEPTWRNNEKHVSCIPAGSYQLQEQQSPLVERITLGKFQRGIFLVDVPGRSRILIHPGNFAGDSKGCILVGMSHASINERPGIERSQIAFKSLMIEHDDLNFTKIVIVWNSTNDVIPQI